MITRLRLVFMGTPDFAVSALRALYDAGHDIAAVYCQPPKPAGRGHLVQKTPVHLLAERLNLAVRTPKSLRDPNAQKDLSALTPDAIVVAAYGLILPKEVLGIPRLGCFNIHGSLLPRWRGAAPIQRALFAGDDKTGITIMRMEEGLDTGPMLLTESTPISDRDTSQTLHDRLAEMGSRLIVTTLELAAVDALDEQPQDETKVVYAPKLTRQEGKIDWREKAEDLARKIRAFTPWPGAFFFFGDEQIKIVEAKAVNGFGPAGTLLDSDFTIACGHGALRISRAARAGRKTTDGAALLRGLRLEKGHVFS